MVAASRKEEERNERIVRGLLKLPPNRRCVNCNGLVRALSVSVLLRGPWLCLPLLIPWRRSMLITQYLCGLGYDSDPGAAVRVHQLLDLRLRLLQRHPVSAALPFPLLSSVPLVIHRVPAMHFSCSSRPFQRTSQVYRIALICYCNKKNISCLVKSIEFTF